MIAHFEDLYIRHLRTYLYVGGMPGVVQIYASLRNYEEVRQAQLNLLRDYREDFSKHAPSESQPRMNMVWDSVPEQLAKENKRFVYNEVYAGARRKSLEIPLRWLQDAGLIHPVPRIKKPALPMSTYWESGISKIYFLDVGLLSAASGLEAGTLLDDNEIFSEFKGALAEQFVQQELRATCELAPCYWASEEKNAKAEVDFLCTLKGNIIPIEVKSGINVRARSLLVYCQRFQPRHAVRTSLRPYSESLIPFKAPLHPYTDCKLTELPLYAISQLPAILTTP
jgi:predicted AAA+ superfamily ATPase